VDAAILPRDELLAVLAALGRPVHEPFDPQGFLSEFSRRLARLIPHDRAVIAHLEDEGRAFTVFAESPGEGPFLHEGSYTMAFDPAGRHAIDEWLLRPLLAGEVIVTADVATDEPLAAAPATRDHVLALGIRARIAAPLTSGGRVIGALCLASASAGVYGSEHADTARRVAELIGPFVESTVAFHRERWRRGRLEALSGLTRVLGASLDVGQIFDRLASAVRPALGFDLMSASLREPNGHRLEIVGLASTTGAIAVPDHPPADDYSFSAVLDTGATMLVRDARNELDPTRPGDQRMLGHGAASLLAVPLWFGERSDGCLVFVKRRTHGYDPEIGRAHV